MKACATRDPLVGSIFENLVVIECLKARYNAGLMSDLYYFRDSKGNEVDLVAQTGRNVSAIEIKSASTFSESLLKGIRRFKGLSSAIECTYLIYNGSPYQLSDGTEALHFKSAEAIFSA